MKDISQQLARQLKEFLYGQSMTGSSLKNVLDDVGYREAVFLLDGFNTIAMLSYHINYYMKGFRMFYLVNHSLSGTSLVLIVQIFRQK